MATNSNKVDLFLCCNVQTKARAQRRQSTLRDRRLLNSQAKTISDTIRPYLRFVVLWLKKHRFRGEATLSSNVIAVFVYKTRESTGGGAEETLCEGSLEGRCVFLT